MIEKRQNKQTYMGFSNLVFSSEELPLTKGGGMENYVSTVHDKKAWIIDLTTEHQNKRDLAK